MKKYILFLIAISIFFTIAGYAAHQYPYTPPTEYKGHIGKLTAIGTVWTTNGDGQITVDKTTYSVIGWPNQLPRTEFVLTKKYLQDIIGHKVEVIYKDKMARVVIDLQGK